MNDYEVISNPDLDGSQSVLVPAHNDDTRRRAATVIVTRTFEPWDEVTEAEAADLLVARAAEASFTQHASFPTDEQGCGCDAIGWWCEAPSNGGETRDFWHFDGDDIEDAREIAEQPNPEDLPENVPAEAEVAS